MTDRGYRGPHRTRIEPPGEPNGVNVVVRGAATVDLVKQPEALLGQRQGYALRPGHRRKSGRAGSPDIHRGKLSHRIHTFRGVPPRRRVLPAGQEGKPLAHTADARIGRRDTPAHAQNPIQNLGGISGGSSFRHVGLWSSLRRTDAWGLVRPPARMSARPAATSG